jgi:hypothetical protein
MQSPLPYYSRYCRQLCRALHDRIVECADDPACPAAICVIRDVDYTRSSREKAGEEVSAIVTFRNALLLSVLLIEQNKDTVRLGRILCE